MKVGGKYSYAGRLLRRDSFYCTFHNEVKTRSSSQSEEKVSCKVVWKRGAESLFKINILGIHCRVVG